MTTQPLFAPYRLSWLLVAAAPLVLANCSSNNDNPGGNGGSTASGGSASGGTPGSGGASSGGAASGGAASGGAPGSGGAASGGATGSGGASSGGAASGGASASGGSSNGGSSNGGQTGGNSGGATGGGGKPAGGAAGAAGASGSTGSGGGSSGSFTLASADMMDGEKFDGKFTCNGGNLGSGVNPELHWSGAPSGTMSFVVTFIDTTLGANNSMGQHWAMYNIPGTVTSLPQGLMKTLSGDLASAKQASPLGGYLAPCAQSEASKTTDDQYEFTVYALSTATLNVSGTNPSVANVLTALGVLPNGTLASSVLGKATFKAHAGYKGK